MSQASLMRHYSGCLSVPCCRYLNHSFPVNWTAREPSGPSSAIAVADLASAACAGRHGSGYMDPPPPSESLRRNARRIRPRHALATPCPLARLARRHPCGPRAAPKRRDDPALDPAVAGASTSRGSLPCASSLGEHRHAGGGAGDGHALRAPSGAGRPHGCHRPRPRALATASGKAGLISPCTP